MTPQVDSLFSLIYIRIKFELVVFSFFIIKMLVLVVVVFLFNIPLKLDFFHSFKKIMMIIYLQILITFLYLVRTEFSFYFLLFFSFFVNIFATWFQIICLGLFTILF